MATLSTAIIEKAKVAYRANVVLQHVANHLNVRAKNSYGERREGLEAACAIVRERVSAAVRDERRLLDLLREVSGR